MPAVNPVTVNLPVSENSGQNLDLDTTLTQSGKAADAKATGDKLAELESKIPGPGAKSYGDLSGKPSINGVTLEGDKTAEELGIGQPTNEQVSTAVSNYLAEHPVTPGATEEEAAAIQRFENIGFSDPYAYGNLLDTATMMLNNTGTPKAGVNVFDLAANWNPEGAWRFMFFPVEAGGKFTVVSAKLPALSEFRVVSRDGIVLEGVPTIGKNPFAVTVDSTKGVSYQTLTIPDDWPADGYYLMLQLGYGTGNTDFDTLMVFRGEYADYQGYAPYNPELGTSSSSRLRVTPENLTDELLNKLNRGDTAIQPQDIKGNPYAWNIFNPGYGYRSPTINSSVLADFAALCNSARIGQADQGRLRLGDKYAHAPTVRVIGTTAYVVAFQNAQSAVDRIDQTTIEFWRVDLANWTVLEQINVASPGMPCGDDMLSVGGIDPNMHIVDDTTLRIIFATNLSAGERVLCYRDYDIESGQFGSIALCKIGDGSNTYDFTISNAATVIGEQVPAGTGINMDTQYAEYNGEYYIAMGADGVYLNLPILKTSDFINFRFWVRPVTDGNTAHYEGALCINGNALWMATRQYKSMFDENTRRMLLTTISLADGSVSDRLWIPDGNIRPFWWKSGNNTYLWHTLNTDRDTATVTKIGGLLPHRIGTVADMGGMIYVNAVEYGGELIVAYMRENALHISRLSQIEQFQYGDVVPMLGKMLDCFGTK